MDQSIYVSIIPVTFSHTHLFLDPPPLLQLCVCGVSVELVEEVWKEAGHSQHEASQVKGRALEHAIVHSIDAELHEWLPRK